MKIRLIGIGYEGLDVVKSCVKHFKDQGNEGFIESTSVLLPTTNEYVAAVDILTKYFRMFSGSAIDQRHLQRALAYGLYGHTGIELTLRERLSKSKHFLTGEDTYATPFRWSEKQAVDEKRRDVNLWTKQFIPDLKKRKDDYNSFRIHINSICDNVEKSLSQVGHALSTQLNPSNEDLDCLHLPELPALKSKSYRTPNIGSRLIDTILSNDHTGRIIDGLGRRSPHDGPDVDVIAIAFSACSSFGSEGVEQLARRIRQTLLHPESTRMISLLGFGITALAEDYSVSGRCVGRYLQHTSPPEDYAGQLDGLILRDTSSNSEPDRSAGFPQLLSAIALSSDPERTQADNPDANQIQRDFGRKLYSAGYSSTQELQYNNANNRAPRPRILQELLDKAVDNLAIQHLKHPTNLASLAADLKSRLSDNLSALANASPDNERPKTPLEKWIHSAENDPRHILFHTARKVIAYVGYTKDYITGAHLRELRKGLSEQFPSANLVVYKYVIDKNLPSEKNVDVPKKPSLAARIMTDAYSRLVGRSTKPPPIPSSPTNATIEGSAGAHLAIFVVDGFHPFYTAYFLNHMNVHFSLPFLQKDDRSDVPVFRKKFLLDLFASSIIAMPFEPNDFTTKEHEYRPALSEWASRETRRQKKSKKADEDNKEPRWRNCARHSVLGGTDSEAAKHLMSVVDKYEMLEGLPDSLRSEAVELQHTIALAAHRLVKEFSINSDMWTQVDVGRVLCALNVLCNEIVEPRRLAKELVAFIA